MAHIGEESGLGVVELGQRFGPSTFVLIRPHAGEGGRELIGETLAKQPVLVVKRAAGVEADHQ